MWKRKVLDSANDAEDEMEKVRGGKFQPQQFRGYCKGRGNYIPIVLPEDGEVAKAN
jgi:hypothetical protein